MFYNRVLRVLMFVIALVVGIRGLSYFPMSNLPEAVREFSFLYHVSYGAFLVIFALAMARIPRKLWYTEDKIMQKDRTGWTLQTCFTAICWLGIAIMFGVSEIDILIALAAVLATGLYLIQTDVGHWPMNEFDNSIEWAFMGLSIWFVGTIGASFMTYAVFNATRFGLSAIVPFLLGLTIIIWIICGEGMVVYNKLYYGT